MLNKYLEQVQSDEIKTWINTALKAYLKRHPEDQGEIEHILDFMASDAAPKRLQKMSYVQAQAGAAKWVKALAKKGKDIDDTNQIEVIKRYKNGFRLVRLAGKEAFDREGKLMAHCVASYFDKESEIYSLRDEKNQPHCTIEVQRENSRVNQIKGKGNGSINPKYIKTVLSVLKHFNMDVRESEMSNLGYVKLEDYELKALGHLFDKKNIFVYNKSTFLFVK